MRGNPFTSDTFSTVWLKHFGQGQTAHTLPHIDNLKFIRHPRLKYFVNIGSTHTKGVSFIPRDAGADGANRGVALIYDVPEYFEVPECMDTALKHKRVKQYPGYYILLEAVKSLDEYLQQQFSKSSRYKLKKYRKRLEASFDVTYKMYRGEISEAIFHSIFEDFRNLLEKRFNEKQITNNNLDEREWSFYKEVALPMIREGKAGLFVVSASDRPVAITLNYFGDRILFDAITVFDTAFAKFHPGSVSIMGLIEWCIANEIRILDFSKGEFDYKKRWATREYRFEYHILYDARKFGSRLRAQFIRSFFAFKQYLRDKQVNEMLHRLTYKLKSRKPGAAIGLSFEIEMLEESTMLTDQIPIDPEGVQYSKLQPALFDFLYLTGESHSGLSVFQNPDDPNAFYLSGVANWAHLKTFPS